MKRFLWILLALCLGCAAAGAENDTEKAALTEMVTPYPGWEVLQDDQWGDTAAAILGRDEQRILCVAEKQDGHWQLVIANENVVPNGITPSLYLDTDLSLFWSYADDWYHYSYISFRENGVWQAPGCIRMDWVDADKTMYTETEHVYQDGLLSFRVNRWDENENLQSEYTAGPFPAKWMAAYDTLATFQEDAAATAAHISDDSWMQDAALRLSAAEILPEYTFVAGSATKKGLEMLMKDEESHLRLVTWQGNSGNAITNISSPLPEGTVYGYENFSHCLWLPQGVVVSLDAYRDGVWHPEYTFEDQAAGEPLFFGRNWIREGTGFAGRYYIGDHPWKDLSLDWRTLPARLEDARMKLDASRWAVVNNPNPDDRLHLRERDDKNAASFGKFYNGTPVEVLRKHDGWVFVRIPGGFTGWMMEKYLAFGTNGWAVENAFPRLHSIDEKERFTVWNAGYVLRGDPSEAWTVEQGETCCIIGVYGDEWYYVWFPELDAGGMMLQSDFWPGNG